MSSLCFIVFLINSIFVEMFHLQSVHLLKCVKCCHKGKYIVHVKIYN